MTAIHRYLGTDDNVCERDSIGAWTKNEMEKMNAEFCKRMQLAISKGRETFPVEPQWQSGASVLRTIARAEVHSGSSCALAF